MSARAAAVAFAALAAGCSATAVPPRSPVTPAEWRANARELVQQLHTDIAETSVGGAKNALANISDLTTLLVVYSDLGACRGMAGATAAPPRVVQALDRPCLHLQKAAALFSRAARQTDASALAAATRETKRAEPGLVRALAAIDRK